MRDEALNTGRLSMNPTEAIAVEGAGVHAPTVVVRAQEGSLDLVPTALWDQLTSLGWLEASGKTVVFQLDAGASQPVIDTVRSLGTFFQARFGTSTSVLDPSPETARLAGFRTRRLTGEEHFRLWSCLQPATIEVPGLWFEDCFIITIVGVDGLPGWRYRGILDVQALPLVGLGNPHGRAELAYEGHRLGRSDLCIACGRTAAAAGRRSWLAASPSDVALEQVLRQFAGLPPETSRNLREIALHEQLPASPRIIGRGIDPGGIAGARGERMWSEVERCRAAWRVLRNDLQNVTRNSPKIPRFIGRRLARVTGIGQTS